MSPGLLSKPLTCGIQTKKSKGVRSGDLGGYNGFVIRFSAGNLLRRKFFCGSRGMQGSIVMLKVRVAEYIASST